jgi:uncharacterized protein YhfF
MNRRKRLQFWGRDQDDDNLVRNVICGRKTATASVTSEYGIPYSEFGDSGYATGDIVEAYDLRGRLRCLIEITDVHTIKFGSIPERVWRGEDFKSEQEFRDVHVRCMPTYKLTDDFEFTIVHFELMETIMAAVPNQSKDPTS